MLFDGTTKFVRINDDVPMNGLNNVNDIVNGL